MCRTQFVLALVALYVGFAHSMSWDFATASDGKLEFYFNGRHTLSENITTDFIERMTYDAVGNRMFYTNRHAIFSYDITHKIETLVQKGREGDEIMAIAFDPVGELLFWSQLRSRGIYWLSLKPEIEKNIYGNLLITTPHDIDIKALAVDSCSRYIYWTNKPLKHGITSTIERARLDGSNREVLIRDLAPTEQLVLDQHTQKLYWTHGTELMSVFYRYSPAEHKQFFIESADFNGKNRTIFYSKTDIEQPASLAVSKDSIYWSHYGQRAVYQLPKNSSIHAKPKEISISVKYLKGTATNYEIKDQIRGIQGCQELKRLLPNNSVTDDNVSFNISSDISLFCGHGVKGSGKSQCECSHGYTGERCDASVCQNYCLQGDCIVSAEEQPTCRCNAGYSGERCQVNDCQGYCLNDGICSLNEESKPVCQCKGNFEGERCDVPTCLNKCFQKIVSIVWDIINSDVTQAALDKGMKSTCASTAV